MMRISALSDPANGNGTNEDWVSTSSGLIVVLDGATVRTQTGCSHGVTWYVAQLGTAVTTYASQPHVPLATALRLAIQHVVNLHPECDLSHPATPSTAVAVIRTDGSSLQYLILGDITLVLDTTQGVEAISDHRVDGTAVRERKAADRHAIGSPEKQAALLAMKHAELAARNTPGGYWVAASDSNVVVHALTGETTLSGLHRMAVLSDGAARIVNLFELLDWPRLLDTLDSSGVDEVVARIRALEAADPDGARWPRNKGSDDATLVYAKVLVPIGTDRP
jgi:hypothetical protein